MSRVQMSSIVLVTFLCLIVVNLLKFGGRPSPSPTIVTWVEPEPCTVLLGGFTYAKGSRKSRDIVRTGLRRYLQELGGAAPPCHPKVIFFAGNQSLADEASRSAWEQEKQDEGDIVQLDTFHENMNKGKSFEWLEYALALPERYAFAFKMDMDVLVYWDKYLHMLNLLHLSGEPHISIGRMNGHRICGKASWCPPKDCADNCGDCWVYMSGGFYGMSHRLLEKVVQNPFSRANRVGYEDLVTGKMVKNAVGCNVTLKNFENGDMWCHRSGIDKEIDRMGGIDNLNFTNLNLKCTK